MMQYALLLLPLVGFLTLTFLPNSLGQKISGWLASATVFVAFLLSLATFNHIHHTGPILVPLGQWIQIPNLNIHFSLLFDSLSSWMTLIITGIGGLIHLYSIGYMTDDDRRHRFFAYLNLFIFFMLVLVLSDTFIGMFVGWEGVGLCSYLLIGFWFHTPAYNQAAKKAFLMNRIGDAGFLLGIFLMLKTFGTTEFNSVFAQAQLLPVGLLSITTLTLLLLLGALGKSAQVPLYTWLPDAMAGPTPVSALIHAATMVTAGIYMITRSHVLYNLAPFTMQAIILIGTLTALIGALIALRQTDIKKVLAYSTISQLGYMFVALGLGVWSTAMFHLTTHAFFKALLFLAAGSVIHAAHGKQDMGDMGGLATQIPVTFGCFIIGTLALVGCPPFSGFFSKDAILLASASHSWILFGMLAITSLLTIAYSLKLVTRVFFGKPKITDAHESPWVMILPMILLATLSLIGGWINLDKLTVLLGLPVIHVTESIQLEHGLFVGTLVAIFVIGWLCRKNTPLPLPGIVKKWISNRFYVDELYNAAFVQPTLQIGTFFSNQCEALLQTATQTPAKITAQLGHKLRRLHTGNVETYFLLMTIGICGLIALGAWLR